MVAMYKISLISAVLILISSLISGQAALTASPKSSLAHRQDLLNERLRLAVAYNDAAKVTVCIKQGGNANARGDEGQTFLELAARYNDYYVVQVLLASGADPNLASDYGGPLSIAAEQGETAIIHLLLQHGANPDGPHRDASPLTYALRCAGAQEEQIFEPKISVYSVNPDTPANREAARRGTLKLMEHFRVLAAQQEQKRLKKKRTAGIQILSMLLARGATVNPKTAEGWTPLMAAAQSGDVKLVQLLVSRGAEVNAHNARGLTVLMQAGSASVVEFLVDKGAKINAHNINGYSVLGDVILWSSTSAAKDVMPAVEFLLAHGADPNLREKDGTTILNLAKDTKNAKLIAALKQAGAQE